MWILYEVEDGKFKKTYSPAELKPVEEYLKMQQRFKHLGENEIKIIQDRVNKSWKELDNLEKNGMNLIDLL
jgi:pyruvate ferredoxin oxidoreductase beta subunit